MHTCPLPPPPWGGLQLFPVASSIFLPVEWGVFLFSPQMGGKTGPREVQFDSDLRRRFQSTGRGWSSPALECALLQAYGQAHPCPFRLVDQMASGTCPHPPPLSTVLT